MFLSRNKKNNVYLCKPQFYYIKVGFKGVNIILACFRDAKPQADLILRWAHMFEGTFPDVAVHTIWPLFLFAYLSSIMPRPAKRCSNAYVNNTYPDHDDQGFCFTSVYSILESPINIHKTS